MRCPGEEEGLQVQAGPLHQFVFPERFAAAAVDPQRTGTMTTRKTHAERRDAQERARGNRRNDLPDWFDDPNIQHRFGELIARFADDKIEKGPKLRKGR